MCASHAETHACVCVGAGLLPPADMTGKTTKIQPCCIELLARQSDSNPMAAVRTDTPNTCLQLATVGDGDLLGGAARVSAQSLNLLDDVQASGDGAEDDVLAIQPLGLDGADEELGAVGVLASVRHGQDTSASVLQGEVLILELGAVDGLAASAVVVGEVTALQHLWNKHNECAARQAT